MPNPKTIKEIESELAVKITELTCYGQQLHQNDIKDDIHQSLLSLLDEVERRLPDKYQVKDSEEYISEVGFNTAIDLIKTTLSNLRRGKE